MPVGWGRAYRRRLNAYARRLMHGEGLVWLEALARAVSELQCGAKTARDGHPCHRKGRGSGGKCELHGGLAGAQQPPRDELV